MSSTGYWVAFALVAVLCATVALMAVRRATARQLLLAWFGTSIVLLGLGYFDWAAQTHPDTSLTTYIAAGFLTPLAAFTVAWIVRRKAQRTIQWFLAALVAFLVEVGVVVGAYVGGF